MKKILISNIGNRNIKYFGNLVETNEENHLGTKSFREKTKLLWENFDSEKKYIELQIIDNQIQRFCKSLVQIYLFTTNQPGHFNYQDTAYEGKIMAELIKMKYGLDVKIYEYSDNPTDEEQIIEFASTTLKEIIFNNSENQIIYNDAGGTPQMKAVIKDLLSYYLKENQFVITYSNQQDEVLDKKRHYAQKYTLLRTARDFVIRYDYEAAFKVLHDVNRIAGLKQELLSYVEIAGDRKNFDREKVKQTINNRDRVLRRNSLLQTYAQRKLPGNISIFPNSLSVFSQSDIFEIASICKLYFNMNVLTLGVATYYRLCEEVLQSWVKNVYRDYDLTRINDRKRLVNNYIGEIKLDYEEMLPEYGLPFLIALGLKYAEPGFKELIGLMAQTNSFFSGSKNGIDLLRNKCYLAHKNQAVTSELIETTNKDFLTIILPSIFRMLGLPGMNIYDQMNNDILALFLEE